MTPRSLKRPQFSPLRYPGGKSALFGFVSEAIRENGFCDGTYVEPYAGGAGIALGLLMTELVESVVVNDLDPAIYSFWKAVTSDSERFVEKIRSTEISVREWHQQREIYLAADATSAFDLGFATFFLNRTNRSGVLNAGVIGGQAQTGPYKIDARFNRETLIERCRLLGLYSDRIIVRNDDGLKIIEEYTGQQDVFLYADPPYFEKGSQLYLNAFRNKDHDNLAKLLNSNADSVWMLTYDDAPEIVSLYPDRRKFNIGINYSVRAARKASELLVTSDSFALPSAGYSPHQASSG